MSPHAARIVQKSRRHRTHRSHGAVGRLHRLAIRPLSEDTTHRGPFAAMDWVASPERHPAWIRRSDFEKTSSIDQKGFATKAAGEQGQAAIIRRLRCVTST